MFDLPSLSISKPNRPTMYLKTSRPTSVAFAGSTWSFRNRDSKLTEISVKAAINVTTSSTETCFRSSNTSFLMNSKTIAAYFAIPSPPSSISESTGPESVMERRRESLANKRHEERRVMRKPSLTTSTLTILSLILGTWLVFDATRKLLTGYYTGEQTIGLGPWATIVYALGVRPADMVFPFLFLGMIWIVNGVIILLGADTRYERAIAISIVTLFYALPGTIVSIITILLSLRKRRLAGL